MTKALIGILTTALSLLLSCNGVKVSCDYNKEAPFSSYKTFAVCIEDLAIENPALPNYDNEKNRFMIADAIHTEMKKYYAVNDTAPDLRVGFHIVINEEKFEYRNCSRSTQYKTPLQCRPDTIETTMGTLMIYVADASRNEVVWQASAIGAVDYRIVNKKQMIDKAVQLLFAKYPLASKKE